MSEARDIVERLRANLDKYLGFNNLNSEAATTIESIRATVGDCRESIWLEVIENDRLRATVAGLEAERGRLRQALELIDFQPLPGNEQDAQSFVLNTKYLSRQALVTLGGEAGKSPAQPPDR